MASSMKPVEVIQKVHILPRAMASHQPGSKTRWQEATHVRNRVEHVSRVGIEPRKVCARRGPARDNHPKMPDPWRWEPRTVSCHWKTVAALALSARQGRGHRGQRPDRADHGTSGNAQALRRGVRQSERSIGARATPMPTTNVPKTASGHRQPGETCAREAARLGRQGTTAVPGPWGRAGAAGRPLHTTAGQAGTTLVGPGTPRPEPIARRLERSATPAHQAPALACTPLAPHRERARRERACGSLNPRSAPGVDRVPGQTDKATLATPLGA